MGFSTAAEAGEKMEKDGEGRSQPEPGSDLGTTTTLPRTGEEDRRCIEEDEVSRNSLVRVGPEICFYFSSSILGLFPPSGEYRETNADAPAWLQHTRIPVFPCAFCDPSSSFFESRAFASGG